MLASLPADLRQAKIDALSVDARAALKYDWRFWARPEQVEPPGDWHAWLVMSGRGFGKTEAGAQWVRERVKAGARSIALIAETQKDLEDVMVPRLLAAHPEHARPTATFRPVRVKWPGGALALGYNGTEPDQLRGPEFDTAWIDELAKYRHAESVMDMITMALRQGETPRMMITTTPRPIDVIKAMVADPSIVVTRGSTFDNADNLAPAFLEQIKRRYEGTRLGLQEIYGEILGDIPGALWSARTLDTYRKTKVPDGLRRIVVAVDAAVTEDGDDHGIIVAGMTAEGNGVVLADGTIKGSPFDWARRAVSLYDEWAADRIVAEVNQGGDMVRHTLQSVRASLPVSMVRASRGKHIRAEPIAALYEQGRVSHVGRFDDLEAQMLQMTSHGYEGSGSPDRLDALVWAMADLFPEMAHGGAVLDPSDFAPSVVGWMA